MTLLAQVGDGQHASLHVVDAHAAPALPGAAIDEDHGDALAQKDVERRGVLLDRRDEHAAHTLFEQ